MAVGGLAIRASRAAKIEADIFAINKAYGVSSEVKWQTAKKRRDNVHLAYIDLLFKLVRDNQAHFHVRICPFSEYDHKISGDRKETDTISKSFYQLLLHRAGRFYANSCSILVRPDNGDCTSYLKEMITALNGDIRKKFSVDRDPIRDLSPVDSKREPLLQLLDVSLGAIASFANGHHQTDGASETRKMLCQHAFAYTSLKTAMHSTAMEDRKFNYWMVRPKGAAPTR